MRHLILLLLLSGILLAQDAPPRSQDITVKTQIHEAKYCLGPVSYMTDNPLETSKVTLKLTLKFMYENHTKETLIVPFRFHIDTPNS